MLPEFADLFEGRHDAYGTEEGGCVRAEHLGDGSDWATMVKTHLLGVYPIGVYPLVPDLQGEDGSVASKVKWGCVDFDVAAPGKHSVDFDTETDAQIAAQNLQRVLLKCGITAWIEVTRSRGRHVWVFTHDWVPAQTMRRALLVASQVAGTPTREVNPKSEGFDNVATLGNYVRLPYPGGALAQQLDNRYMLQNDGSSLACDVFVEIASKERATRLELEQLAQYWTPPKPVLPPAATQYVSGGGLDDLIRKLVVGGRALFRDGPLDEDRSGGLFRLAAYCYEAGLPMSDGIRLVTDADARWGKFSERPDGARQIQRMVERAYR